MARRRGEAWVTYVANDDAVRTALVLAASLRETRTTRKIAVIVTTAVTKESGNILRDGFDDVILLDDNLVSNELTCGGGPSSEDLRGKIFAFSLVVYDKCIFLPARSLVLENCDDLFDVPATRNLNIRDFGGDMSMFLCTPKLALCKFLEDCRQTAVDTVDFLPKHVSTWMRNNSPKTVELNNDGLPVGLVKFSGEIGITFGRGHHQLKLVNFVDIPENGVEFVAKLRSLWNGHHLGLIEKKVVGEWLKVFEELVTETLTNPRASLNWKESHHQGLYDNEPIAIIGMSCRYPGAGNVEEFWRLLHAGEEGICVAPPNRWTKEHSIFHGSQERETHAGFLTVPVDEFDLKFFGISPKEAVSMDPQARLLHEVMWEGLEDGGIDPLGLRGSHTGIFVGSWMYDYKDIVQNSTERDFFRTYMGNSIGATAARLSILLGLTGPNIATESGCSSSIVAVDLAVKSLRNGETNLAIAGGVNLLLHPFRSNLMDQVLAPDGRCKTFDEKANGFGRAEGCGVLVLKRLSDAIRDRDHIWAMIRGSAISQEGMSRSLGTPTAHCEALAMQLAMDDAGVGPEDVSFVETHGTGTSVGDPMEVAAITKVFQSNTRENPLIIGSVKTNVGHTESCSGITGIMKTVLAMQNEVIPKHINFDALNPNINLDIIPAKLPVEPIPWPKVQGLPRIAGVSSFGITGTDGHVVLEEAPDYVLPKFTFSCDRPLHLIKFSAKNKEALEDIRKQYVNLFKEQQPHLMLSDVAHSANTGRASFSYRAFLIAKSLEESVTAVESDKLIYGDTSGRHIGKICFLFTGQGSQYVGMAKTLYETSPVFRVHFDQCDSILRRQYNLFLRETLWESDNQSKELSRTIYSQTSIFCVEYCLLKLWESWGVKPDCVLGHSLGEFCAAVAAGIMTFEDALTLVAERSRLIDALPRGSMLVIKASQPEVGKLMKNANIDLDYAAVNSSDQTVVAGDTEDIQEFLAVCKANSMKAVVLDATHAFHSRHMDPMLDEYRKVADTVKYAVPSKCQYISGMKGVLLNNSAPEITADYWVDHTRQKVSFLEACNSLKELNCQHFVEIGPQPVLSTFVLQNVDNQPISCYPSLRRNTNDWETILTSLGKLYLNEVPVDWEGYDAPYNRKKIPSCLPFHPFYRKSFWVDCSANAITPVHPLIGSPLGNASALGIFQNNLSLKWVPYLKGHCIGERVVFPGAGFAEMCLSAGHCVANGPTDTLDRPRRPIALENFAINLPLQLIEAKPSQLQVIVDPQQNVTKEPSSELGNDSSQDRHSFQVKIFRRGNFDNEAKNKWHLHVTSTFHPAVSVKEIVSQWDVDKVRHLMSTIEPTSGQAFIKRAEGVGFNLRDAFQSIEKYWLKMEDTLRDELVGEVKVTPDLENYLLHPLVLDAMIQAVFISVRPTKYDTLSVPNRIGKLVWLNDMSENKSKRFYLHVRWENDINTIFLADENLSPLAFVRDIQLIQTNVKTIESILEQQTSTLPDCWEETWKPISGPLDHRVELPNLEPVFESEDFAKKLEGMSTLVPEDLELEQRTGRLLYLYQVRALLKLGWKPVVGETFGVKEFCQKHGIIPTHHLLVHHYFAVCNGENGTLEFDEERELWKVNGKPEPANELEVEINRLCETFRGHEKVKVVTDLYRVLGERLPQILRGEESVLPLLTSPATNQHAEFPEEMFYQNHPGKRDTCAKFAEILGTITRKFREENENNQNGKLRILEIGAGTGCRTQEILPVLQGKWGSKFEYYCTDISSSFFVHAEKKLEEFKKNLKFCVFDVEKSGLTQGIPLNYFDLVVATHVLHATRNLEETLGHVRETLRPGGTLLFTESVTQERGTTFVFGLLEGYWRFNDFKWRSRHPCVGIGTWRQVLLHRGFDNTYAAEAYMSAMAVFAAHATIKDVAPIPRNINFVDQRKWVIFGNQDNVHRNLIQRLSRCGSNQITLVLPSPDDGFFGGPSDCIKKVISPEDCATQVDAILSKDNIQAIIYAWGLNTERKDQKEIAHPFFHIAKTLLTLKSPPKLFVCTRGVHSVNPDMHMSSHPGASTLFGMVKSLKNENSDMFVRYIDLEYDTGSEEKDETVVNEILFELAMHKESREKERVQVAYREGQRYEPRFSRVNLRTKFGEELKLPGNTSRYQLVLPESRLISDLTFDVLEEEPLTETHIEVRTVTYALNFRDLFTIMKPIAAFERTKGVGSDFAGVVTRVGSGVGEDHFKIGDRVVGLNNTEVSLNSHLIVEAAHALKIPERMTFAEASTMPLVFATSLFSFDVAKIQKGETVLIHTGSGGVGLAAIQVAKYFEANIITTAGSPRKQAYLRSLGIQHVFHSRNTEYREEILKVTQGRGVDIVLNSLTSPGFKEATLDVTAKNGRFIEMSKLAVWTVEEVRERRPDVEYTIVDVSEEKYVSCEEMIERLDGHVQKHEINGIPYLKFDALLLRQALQFLQKAKHIGKVVVTMPEVKVVEGQWKVCLPLFNANGTYLITGGLGGIGFEVCKWMLEKGATNIVLIGRSPPKPEISKEIGRLNNSNKGYSVIVKQGDVGDFDQMKLIIEEIKENYPDKPIRGIQHCAGVLRDNMYSNQTVEAFEATFNPKVKGTWHLHELTKDMQLEHFVLYSSLTALAGTPAQSNYVAANCFEDAFAHYRYSLGLPATAINWGQWSQVGCAKDINITGVLPVSVKRMLHGLEVAMRIPMTQISFGDFESLNLWTMACPLFKHYLDDRLLKRLKDATGKGSQLVLRSDKFWQEVDEALDKTEKMNVLIRYLKDIIREALRIDPDENISEDALMQDLGVDSLMLIELKNTIQGLLGSRLTLTANMLKDCHTIRDLATVVVNKICDENERDCKAAPLLPEELTKLLESDIILDERIHPTTKYEPADSLKTVLITGATGQLGPYILSKLCQPAYVTLGKIVCLVRTKEGKCPKERLQNVLESMNLTSSVDLNKVDCLRGDVTQLQFGLSAGEYKKLTDSVGAVIHLAAKSNHVEAYTKGEGKTSNIRSVNVEGTLNILRFAASGTTKCVYYASSILAVLGQKEESTLCDNWPEAEEIQILTENKSTGYPASKFVCEMLLKQANERGIPCKIFRFPWILGDSSTGQLNHFNNHYILRFLSYLKTKSMPSAPIPAVILPVDICADLSLKLFWNKEAPHEIYNITHPSPQVEPEFVGVAKEHFGVEVDCVDWKSENFLQKLYASDMPLESLKEIYEDVGRGLSVAETVQAIQGYLKAPDTFFKNGKLEQFLPGWSHDIPETMDIIRRDLTYVKSKGVFDKLGI